MTCVAKSTKARAWLQGAAIVALSAALLATGARAETIGGALAKAYLNNPDINQQRAAVRVQDENIPKTNSGYLPNISAEGDVGRTHMELDNVPGASASGGVGNEASTTTPRGVGLTVTQSIFNGNRTGNSVRQAESSVFGAREQLRNTEQNVLLSAVGFYMDVLRDTAILDLDRNNVEVLQEQLRQTQDRFNVGEVTRTDVAQAEASLAGARATALGAQSQLQASLANYRQVIGDDPKSLTPVAPLHRQLPKVLPEAIAASQLEHPAIVAMLHGIDAAALQVKIAEGALYPTVGVTGQLQKRFDYNGTPGEQLYTASIVGQVSVPIYDGGLSYATTRQAKEQLSQTELQTDLQRDKVRAAVVAAWGANENSSGVLRAARAEVQAAEVALAGVREEAKVGQRTTLDVLNAQQTLLNARVQLVTAQHDSVVNSYSLLSAVGRLSIQTLGLAVPEYDPRIHFDQVKNKLFGVRTPDGK
jgi:outer membrane protein